MAKIYLKRIPAEKTWCLACYFAFRTCDEYPCSPQHGGLSEKFIYVKATPEEIQKYKEKRGEI
jgi:hypothetical protein